MNVCFCGRSWKDWNPSSFRFLGCQCDRENAGRILHFIRPRKDFIYNFICNTIGIKEGSSKNSINWFNLNLLQIRLSSNSGLWRTVEKNPTKEKPQAIKKCILSMVLKLPMREHRLLKDITRWTRPKTTTSKLVLVINWMI